MLPRTHLRLQNPEFVCLCVVCFSPYLIVCFVSVYRDILLLLGVCSVSKRSCSNILRKGPGEAIVIVRPCSGSNLINTDTADEARTARTAGHRWRYRVPTRSPWHGGPDAQTPDGVHQDCHSRGVRPFSSRQSASFLKVQS